MAYMMSFDGDMIEDIRSLVQILVRQSYSECLALPDVSV